jgi:predicted membrane protein (TIGR00267 family)
MASFRDEVARLREYEEVVDIGEIARRGFAMQTFDGILTILGVLAGNYLAEVRVPEVIIVTGLATSVSMGVSGLWGAYLTESAERQKSLDDLQGLTLSDLTNTRIGRASGAAVVIVAVVGGMAPLLSSAVVLAPFFLTGLLGDIRYSYYLALGVAMVGLFGLGAFLGHISKQSMVLAGLKTIIAGVVALVLSFLIEGAIPG